MTTAPGHLPRRPRAETMSIDDLVAAAIDERRIRVPSFQRRMRWVDEDMCNLLDSIYRGYPIGSLLLWERNGVAGEVVLGRWRLDAPSRGDAWFVVDGQQRITALANTLRRGENEGDDASPIYFDLDAKKFVISHSVPAKQSWLPATKLLDAVTLNAWLIERFPSRPDIQRVALDVGSRIREYKVPIYVVQSDDEGVLREIFRRANNHGAEMTQAEVFDALVGSTGSSPQRLDQLADDLARMGMGRPAEHMLLQVVHAVRGRDPTKLANPKDMDAYAGLEGAVAETAAALRRVLAFLRDDAEIPHLRLLPYQQPLIVLPRFFRLFPEPSPRSRSLLARWVWRGFMTGAHIDTRTPAREGVRQIVDDDEERSVQNLLAQVPADSSAVKWVLSNRVDARSAIDRIALLGLASLGPRSFDDYSPLDVRALMEEHGSDALRSVGSDAGAASGVASRILHPPMRGLPEVLRGLAQGAWPGLLESHAIDNAALKCLVEGRVEDFVEQRGASIRQLVLDLAQRKCGWGYGDRPSIKYLLGGTANP